jgi:hypothetical protein
MIRVHTTGDWVKASRILGAAPMKIRVALDRAVLQEAHFFRRKVVEGFREQAPGGKQFKPLSETTLAIRRFKGFGGTKALIVTGDLRNSISVIKKMTTFGAEAFVGVLRSARGKGGRKLINIAEVHEFGSRPIMIPVTPAMRKFLMAAFSASGLTGGGGGGGGFRRGIIIVKIPARPFIRPVIEKYFDGPKAAARFHARVAANLGGILGHFGPARGGPGGGLGSIVAKVSRG